MSSSWAQHVWSSMNEPVIYGECKDGPWDGHRQAVVPDVDTIWVGSANSAWVVESGIAPETVVNRDLHAYRWDGHTLTPDGARVYQWIEPQASGGEIVR